MNANAALTQAQIQIASEIEIEMMQDLYTRLIKQSFNLKPLKLNIFE